MANSNYTTEFQVGSIEKRLKTLSSSAKIEGLDRDQLLSNLITIHENHNQLLPLIGKSDINQALLVKRLCILSAVINVNGVPKDQLVSTHNTIQDIHCQLSILLNKDRAKIAKFKIGAAS